MERTTLWSRVGDWIRNPRKSLGWEVTETDIESENLQSGFPSNGANSSKDFSPRRSWTGFGKRGLIEEQTRQVSELVNALQGHVQRQTQVAESANQNLERLIQSLATLPVVLQAQQQQLNELQNRLDSQPAVQKQVQEILTRLGSIRDAVAESSASFSRYSEGAQRTGEAVAAELQKQGQAVAQLAQSADPMLRAISSLRTDVSARGEELSQYVSTLNKKLVQFASAALVLALVAAIIGIVAFFR